jgi:hypothetical protein
MVGKLGFLGIPEETGPKSDNLRWGFRFRGGPVSPRNQ